MYTLVLAAMLTTGEVTPDFGRGCWGCSGCYGGCHGCYGNAFSCHGCCGGCFGCYGCCGGCYGCGGCFGCCGGCYGCYGGCHGCFGGCYGCYGCGGCFGCYGCGGCHGCSGGVVIIQQQPAAPKQADKKEKKEKKEKEKKEKGSLNPNQATVVVEVPAEAGLFVEGQSVPMPSSTQSFNTPALEPGKTYYYTMKAVGDRSGQLVYETKRVEVRAGETVRVAFKDLKPEAGADVARVSVRLPADARLLVDGVACLLTSSKREFDTPKLEPGRRYAYTLKAEVVRDGQTLTEEKQVILQAGRKVMVEFTKLRAEAAASR